MQLSIIIVNYKTPGLVVDCLRSVYAHTHSISFEVIVVDNDSQDTSRQLIVEQFRHVRWIQLNYNAGFARANNEGIRHSTGEIILLLNSDTTCSSPAIEQCLLQFSKDNYVACGVQLINPDGTAQISGNYFVKGGLNNLLSLPYTGTMVKTLAKVFQINKPHVAEARTTVEVDWINGAFLMVKKDVIEKAGLLDEDFFLYAEEAEWCSRIRKHGKCCIYGQWQIIHLQGETSTVTFATKQKGYKLLHGRKGLQIMLSNFLRIRKQWGMGWYFLQMLFYTVEVPVYFAAQMISNIFRLQKPFKGFSIWTGFAATSVDCGLIPEKLFQAAPIFIK